MRKQLPWMFDLRVGDVIARPNGAWRIVREVTRYPNGDLRCVTMVIRRCSWTRRGVTVLNYNDLRRLNYRRVASNAKMNTPIDERIRQACALREHCVTCNEVRGVA